MKTLNVTVYAEDNDLLTAEGTPDELDIPCESARFFMMKYPGLQIMLWVLDEVTPKQAMTALQDVVSSLRSVAAVR
jgi:hypothetical protein